MSENTQQRVAWQVAYGEAPVNGSRAMPQTLDFTVETSIGVNLTYEQESQRLEFVQSIYIDNSTNPNPLTGTCRGSGQIFIIPGGWQGYIPVLASVDNAHITFTTVKTPIIPINLLSFPVPAILWPANAGNSGQDFSTQKPAATANLITTIPANGQRAEVEIQNQSGETIQLFLDDGAGGNISVILLPAGTGGAGTGGAAWSSNFFKGRIRVFGATSSDQIMARQA